MPPRQPIKIDGRSLVDLKAIVYAKEQKTKLDGGAGSGGAGLRGLRGKRAAAGDSNGAARKDPFARSNRGVEDRSQRDELERVTASKKRKSGERTMAAKSRLYEKMGEFCGPVSGSIVTYYTEYSGLAGLLSCGAVVIRGSIEVGGRTLCSESWI